MQKNLVTKPAYSKQLCLFLDVLGTKERNQENPTQILQALHRVYQKTCYDVDFENGFWGSNDVHIQIFSDNIAIVNNIRGDDF